MRPLYAAVMGVLGLAFLAAGCGGAVPSGNGGPATVKLTSSSKEGSYLVDGQGHSLYLFEKDEKGDSYCSGACAAVWPPLETDSTPHPAGGVNGGALGTMKRDDGETQVTYDGHPLYYYAADASTPGKTTGQEVDQFGAEWYLVDRSGHAVESKDSRSGSKPGSKNEGGGYG